MENSRLHQIKQLVPTVLLFGTLLLLPFLDSFGQARAEESTEMSLRANQVAADLAQMRAELSVSRSALERAAGTTE